MVRPAVFTRLLFIQNIKTFHFKSNPNLINKSLSTMANTNIVAICHMRSTNDKKHNQQQVQEIVRQSKERNAAFVFLPECCDFVGTDRAETLAMSETLDGPLINFYKDLARNNNIWLSIGGFHELAVATIDNPKPDKIHNSHLIIDNAGELVEKYQKLHLYDVDTPEFKFRESNAVIGGHSIVPPLTTPIGPLGLMICYDLRFPELSTILRKRGATVLTYPSAFAYSTGKAHWEIMLRARAIENQCFVIASAQVGFHNAKRQSYGHAMIVDPWGRILAECDNDKDVDVATVDLDLGSIEKVRRNMPCLEHRRNDIYSLMPIEMTVPLCPTQDFLFETFPIPPSTIFYETEHSIAFTNIRCVVTGHVLVASRRFAARLKDLTAEESIDFFNCVSKVQRMTERYYETISSTVTVQDGVLAGQTVKHVHCHIMPRRKGDFARNDDIYIALSRHDDPGLTEEQNPRRSFEEMSQEACEYRKCFEEMKGNKVGCD